MPPETMTHAIRLALFALLATLTFSFAQGAAQDDDKKHPQFAHLNVNKDGLALAGYDPVAYFPEGGSKAQKGSKKITAKHRGVTYRFASEKNKKAFEANPEKFEPQYGGWCAWALSDGKGSKVDPSPKYFTVENGKLYLFYKGLIGGNTRKSWNKGGGAPKLAPLADANWTRITKPKPKK